MPSLGLPWLYFALPGLAWSGLLGHLPVRTWAGLLCRMSDRWMDGRVGGDLSSSSSSGSSSRVDVLPFYWDRCICSAESFPPFRVGNAEMHEKCGVGLVDDHYLPKGPNILVVGGGGVVLLSCCAMCLVSICSLIYSVRLSGTTIRQGGVGSTNAAPSPPRKFLRRGRENLACGQKKGGQAARRETNQAVACGR